VGLMSTDVKPFPSEKLVLNMGPSHPVTHGTLRIQMEVDGETILRSACEIGYLHRGYEKQSESCVYQNVVPYAERMNYCSPIHNSNAWCYAVEQLLGIEAPPRAQAIRVITSELGRLIDHLVCLAANILDFGGLTNYWYLFNYRERVYDLFEELCGHRLMVNYPRIGGVSVDLTDDWLEKVTRLLADLHEPIEDVKTLIAKNRIFVDRAEGVCVIDPATALSFGFTGPCLRATGVSLDHRRDNPYWGYEKYKFDVPLRHNGDTLDRMMIRFDEMEESRKIVLQAAEAMPDGPWLLDDPLVTLPDKALVYNTMEGLIRHFKIVMHGIQPPVGDIYSFTESPNGELGFYIVSDGSPVAYRVRVRPPSFMLFSAFHKLINGSMIADAASSLGSLNVIAGELDR
jgi:NADH-quinone oxidoreductase subunit C/D